MEVRGDADRLVQVLANLLSNAVRAAPAGSEVEIGVEVADGRAVVAVDDRGPGVPPEFRERIFGRFERAARDEGAPGTGLGLAISREIVTRHGGAIWFEDRDGGGARFAFALPMLPAPADEEDGPVVLVCEEDEAFARVLTDLVVAEGCGWARARSAVEARDMLASRRVAALVVGTSLPDEGGLAFAHSIRSGSAPADAPLLLVARATRPGDDGPAAFELVDWIEKPGDTDRLSHALRTALTRSDSRRPVILHLDDDPDLLEVVGAAIEPEATLVGARDLAAARAALRTTSPDAAILDVSLARESGVDLIPFLVDGQGLPIPTIIYSAENVPADLARHVDAVLIKGPGSLPDLKATIRRVLSAREMVG